MLFKIKLFIFYIFYINGMRVKIRYFILYEYMCRSMTDLFALAMAHRRLGNIKLNETVVFVCDIQERFRGAVEYFSEIAEVSNRLTEASRILNIPLIVTEQYPKGLGSTVSEVNITNAVGVFPKTKFSMVLPEVEEKLKTLCGGNVRHIILCGVEAHVCIQQTVIDLLSQDFEVHVVADAVSSRNQVDRIFAFERFRQMGAYVTTSEAILLQLVGDKDHPQFKEIQGLIKVLPPGSGLINKL
ncbi:isochorismatase domain-containing protein 1-like isoform X2 [Physella acuta]|uniref:isochorismatase domain-containing protein 1-like isoform X2 n=1 Tax=Physella acuta TaxID=109671 RepID=UPI0027DBE5B1|nr:isochorismatase domain-containing protein 1-like isoform X2 [Physella acuta]